MFSVFFRSYFLWFAVVVCCCDLLWGFTAAVYCCCLMSRFHFYFEISILFQCFLLFFLSLFLFFFVA